MPSSAPRSQCALGVKSNFGGVPHLRTSTLSSALFPTGTLACGRFGMPARMSRSRASRSAAFFSSVEIFSRSSLVWAMAVLASCPLFFNLAMSSEALLRSALLVSASVMAWRRCVSTSRKSFSTAAGSMPRWRSFSSTTGRFSRTKFRSSMIEIEQGNSLMYRKSAGDCTPASCLFRRLQRSQISHDRLRILHIESVRRHRRPRRKVVGADSGHQKPDGHIFLPSRKSCDIGRLVGPHRHRSDGLKPQCRSLQPLLLNQFALLIARRVAVAAQCHVLDEIFPSRHGRARSCVRPRLRLLPCHDDGSEKQYNRRYNENQFFHLDHGSFVCDE